MKIMFEEIPSRYPSQKPTGYFDRYNREIYTWDLLIGINHKRYGGDGSLKYPTRAFIVKEGYEDSIIEQLENACELNSIKIIGTIYHNSDKINCNLNYDGELVEAL